MQKGFLDTQEKFSTILDKEIEKIKLGKNENSYKYKNKIIEKELPKCSKNLNPFDTTSPKTLIKKEYNRLWRI